MGPSTHPSLPLPSTPSLVIPTQLPKSGKFERVHGTVQPLHPLLSFNLSLVVLGAGDPGRSPPFPRWVHRPALLPSFLPRYSFLSDGCLQWSAYLHIRTDWHVPRPMKEQAFTSVSTHFPNSLWCPPSLEPSQGKNPVDIISIKARRRGGCHLFTQRPNMGQMKAPGKRELSSRFILCNL